jgi:hypothetical protein
MSRQRAERGIHQRALGRSRGGFTSKVHCLGDARGRPIAFQLTPGEAADCKSYDTLIDLPEQAPDALLADKAYDTDAIRADLKKRGISPSSRRNQTAPQRSATTSVSTASATASNACSVTSKSIVPSQPATINSPTASSECYMW